MAIHHLQNSMFCQVILHPTLPKQKHPLVLVLSYAFCKAQKTRLLGWILLQVAPTPCDERSWPDQVVDDNPQAWIYYKENGQQGCLGKAQKTAQKRIRKESELHGEIAIRRAISGKKLKWKDIVFLRGVILENFVLKNADFVWQVVLIKVFIDLQKTLS